MKMHMLRIKLTIILLMFSKVSYGIVGLTDWSDITPGGNQINNFVGQSLYLKDGRQIDFVCEWYFYKGCIIGRQREACFKEASILGYFVVNETTLDVHSFISESDWDIYREKNDLKPIIWTRWYESDWTFFNDDFFLFYFFFFFISIPLTISFLNKLWKAIGKEKFNFRKPNTIIVSCILGLIFITWLLEQFPQSI